MQARRNRGRWSTLAAALSVLALVIIAGWLARVWVRDGAAVADPRASVLAFLLAAALAATTLVGWVRRRRAAATASATAEQVRQAAATLAEVVTEQWAQEATARSLGNPEPMPVRWRLSAIASGTPVMDHPEMIAAGLTFAGTSDRITELVAAFRRLDRRRLVITGGPGTGKTTLAVQLLLELLDDPQPNEPVPVLFSLVGWDPQEQPRMQDWLTGQLERDYPALRGFGIDTARALVERGKILPILDGLDEVPITLRSGIITALNAATLSAKSGLILTSRRAEYAEAVVSAGDVLTAAAVIAPLALTGIDAATYLRKHLPPDPDATWSTVLDQLEIGTASDLAAVTASPLGLWLVRTVYLDARRDPTPLVEDTHPDRSAHSTLKAHLLDQLIPAVLHNRPPAPRRRSADGSAPLRPRRSYDPDDVRIWLTTLAEELRAARTRDWLWWHLARHTFPTTFSSLTTKLIVVLAFGLFGWLVVGLAGGLAIGLAGGLAFGLVIGLTAGLTAAPKHTDLRLKERVPELLRSLANWLAITLPIGLAIGLTAGLKVGLANGLALGLIFGLRDFLASATAAQRSASPVTSYRGDLKRSAVEHVIFGLASGLVVGLAFGLAFGLMVGLAFGLAGWPEGEAWPVFLLASGWLVVRRRLPGRLMAFLNDAYRLGLLRVVGSAYQFRHAELQDYLAPDDQAAHATLAPRQ